MTGGREDDVQVRYDVFATPADASDPAHSLLEQVAAVVHAEGDRLAVVDRDRHLSYQELWRNASVLAGSLRDAGCVEGDRVCLDLPNSVGWVEALLGVLLAGCVAVPVDQRATQAQRAFVREDSAARLSLTPDSLPGHRRSRETHLHRPELDELAILLYTSGTTGTPKGVMITHRNVASYRRVTRSYLGRDRPDEPFRNLVAIPLWHSAGCNTQLIPTLALGGTTVIAPGAGPDSILPMIEEWKPDLMFAVPVVYSRLLDAVNDDPSVLRSLRDVHFGAASSSPVLVRALRKAMPWARLGNAFGMTEISNVALFLPDDYIERGAGSVGFPVPGVECEIRDADESGRGSLYLRGPNMARGYWRRPELTEQTFGTGWVRSGDVAEIGREGAVYLRDRIDDVINRGGEKIYSTTVEEALLELPGVVDAAVVGRPDPDLGARVAALIVGETTYDAGGLRAVLTGRLPGYAIPAEVVTQQEPLPRSSAGKVVKRVVEERIARAEASTPRPPRDEKPLP